MTWIIVTAIVSSVKTRQMRVNFDNVVSYGPAEASPTMLLCNDGQAYPIQETPDQLDAAIGANMTKFAPITPSAKPRKKR